MHLLDAVLVQLVTGSDAYNGVTAAGDSGRGTGVGHEAGADAGVGTSVIRTRAPQQRQATTTADPAGARQRQVLPDSWAEMLRWGVAACRSAGESDPRLPKTAALLLLPTANYRSGAPTHRYSDTERELALTSPVSPPSRPSARRRR